MRSRPCPRPHTRPAPSSAFAHSAAHAVVYSFSRTMADLLPALLGCFERLGGVPEALIVDNDASIVAGGVAPEPTPLHQLLLPRERTPVGAGSSSPLAHRLRRSQWPLPVLTSRRRSTRGSAAGHEEAGRAAPWLRTWPLLVANATNGAGSLDALDMAGEANLGGRAPIDISNPLDFSKGMPPTLFVSNTDSLGEQIQRALIGGGNPDLGALAGPPVDVPACASGLVCKS